MTPVFAKVVVLRRAQEPAARRMARRGYLTLLAGLATTTVGVAGDYWANGAGFPLEALGLLAMVLGVTVWGIVAARIDVVPRVWSWILVLCGPAALLTSALAGMWS